MVRRHNPAEGTRKSQGKPRKTKETSVHFLVYEQTIYSGPAVIQTERILPSHLTNRGTGNVQVLGQFYLDVYSRHIDRKHRCWAVLEEREDRRHWLSHQDADRTCICAMFDGKESKSYPGSQIDQQTYRCTHCARTINSKARHVSLRKNTVPPSTYSARRYYPLLNNAAGQYQLHETRRLLTGDHVHRPHALGCNCSEAGRQERELENDLNEPRAGKRAEYVYRH